MIRVLIVDDSAVLRQTTRFILTSDANITVIGEATNGADAVAMAERMRPDVITMDIRMPKMDGPQAIRQIMAASPVPIIVVTGVDLAHELDLSTQLSKLGAVSILQRPEVVSAPDFKVFTSKLIEQVKLMSTVKVVRRVRTEAAALSDTGSKLPMPVLKTPVKTEIVAIGSSTGGPAALHKLLGGIPADFPVPIVVVQHISFGFVQGLADWLNDACQLSVKVAQAGEKIHSGTVYLAPDNNHMLVDRLNRIMLNPSEPIGGHRPAVTALFQSVAQSYGPAAMAVILTGMGADGAVGMRALYEAGAVTIAQDEASCVVFGMPKEAIALGAVQQIVPLDRIAQTLTGLIAMQGASLEKEKSL
ncbi:MAG: chemotaxis-specific protein-glutamate methyltransferase CheB [Chloroflexi bacterium]|nr:chemotaxis-specific protein-glutamate methyltransferase CheB [Chloroflexota bacterium]